MIHVVDVASTEGRDPVDDINKINKELEAYNPEIAKRPQIIAANKTDAIYVEEGEEDPVERLKKEFEPKGIPVYPISAVSGKGLKELLYAVQKKLDELPKERMVFEQEFFPEDMLLAENCRTPSSRTRRTSTALSSRDRRSKKCSATPIWIPRKVLLSSSGSKRYRYLRRTRAGRHPGRRYRQDVWI